ncbi:hypothetical protein [Stutzerimonas kunmingensis]|uniref:hypothetical protein n=1 Tax=Stutzerimonas kunmingensis TaxID=1211807 RepID=UPI001F3EACC7|nr:hypothetical protein [Stutzerimonas kunmingensis]UIP33037.1 hypothetical protein LW136_00770 [Stutzerimonas kunmingensis]
MDKVYRLLDWLDSAQVIDWLEALTGTPFTPSLLRAICLAEKCPVYLDCRGLEGFIKSDEPGIGYPVSGTGYSRILQPAVLKPLTLSDDEKGQPLLYVAPTQWIELEGPVVTRCAAGAKEHLSQHWSALPPNSHIVHFKTTDIESLSDKMNGGTKLPAEAENLRKQLELESAGRYVAEGEILDLRDELGAEREARLSAERRAKKAEAAAAKLRQEMEATYHAQKADEEYRAGEAYRNHLATGLTEPSADPVNGLQFPYSTKELEAMRKVASEHWANLTPDKRQPTQLSIQKALCDALGLKMDKNGDPPRKTKALATAIRPDSWPDTTG